MASIDDARDAVIDRVLSTALDDPTIKAASEGLIAIDDLEEQARQLTDQWWAQVLSESQRWEARHQAGQELYERLAEQSSVEVLQPRGPIQRIRAAFVDKSPTGLRQYLNAKVQQSPEYAEAGRRESLEFDALSESMLQRCALPSLRSILNDHLVTDVENSQLSAGDSSGLDQLLPEGFQLDSRSSWECQPHLAPL